MAAGPDPTRSARSTVAAARRLPRWSRCWRATRSQRIHSSAARRCRETVTPLAEAVDLPIDEDRLLGEVAALDDPASASATLVDLVQRPGRAVICGQRKSLDIALPALLDALGVTGPVAVPGKGGLLVLHVPEGGATALVEGVEPLA